MQDALTKTGIHKIPLIGNYRKIPRMVASVLLIVIISMIGFGSAIIYSMARWHSLVTEAYARPLAIYKAIADTSSILAQLNNSTMELVHTRDPGLARQLQTQIQVLETGLHAEFAAIETGLPNAASEIATIEHALNAWQAKRTRLVKLVLNGSHEDAIQLASDSTILSYHRLEESLNKALAVAHQQAERLAQTAQRKSNWLIRLAWGLLGGLAVSNVLAGILVVRRVRTTLKHDRQMTKMLYESEERLKLALSGADEGTWDLDVPSGKINFDSQWGDILGYSDEQERPKYLKEWIALIHPEDKERVLKTIQDHADGWTSEYKAEYRIRTQGGAMRWVMGHGRAVRRNQAGKALRMVGVTRDITMKKEVEDRIWKLAHSDFLTGLPNRPLFYDHLRQAIAHAKRRSQKLALLFIDLDGFKLINDQFGHDTGDGVLQEVANRLRLNIRGEDTVARTGGDEFIVILNGIHRPEDAAVVADKIILALGEQFTTCGNTCSVGGSIGISIFPDDSDELETLVSHADDAMYQAKEKGKNNYQFYSSLTQT